MKRPVIGITLDYGDPEKNGDESAFSKYRYYALRFHYSDIVVRAGGIPVLLSYNQEVLQDYIDMIDGLLVPGGSHDVHPRYYGQENNIHPKTKIGHGDRSEFERTVLKRFFDDKRPALGICRGMQVMSVLFGGSMIQHIPDMVETDIDHMQKDTAHHTSHDLIIEKGTKLFEIYGQEHVEINSAHHQAVKDVGNQGMIVSARAPDGVIEAVEHPDHPFFLGVEWHPEFDSNDKDFDLIKAFVDACRK